MPSGGSLEQSSDQKLQENQVYRATPQRFVGGQIQARTAVARVGIAPEEIINEQKDKLGIDPASLIRVDEWSKGRISSATFIQTYNGIPIYDSEVGITMIDGKAVLLGSRASLPKEIDTTPRINAAMAEALARTQLTPLSDERIAQHSAPSLMIYRDENRVALSFMLGFLLEEPPEELTIFIDAKTGEILARKDTLRDTAPTMSVSGVVLAPIYQENIYDGLTLAPLPNLYVNFFDEDGATDEKLGESPYITSSNGSYNASQINIMTDPGPLPGQPVIRASLEGLFVKVVDADGPEEEIKQEIVADENGNAKNNISFPAGTESNVYYQINRGHEFISSFGFSKIDFQIPAVVGYGTNYCNAFYSGLDNLLAFGDGIPSQDCNNLALDSDVILHEYGHAILHQVYDPPYDGQSGAIDEAFADYFACSMNDDPVQGEGTFIGGARDISIDRRYPEDIVGEVHDDSLILSSALWDIRQALGKETTDTLVITALQISPHPYSFADYLENMIIADDNNANLADGPPNRQLICFAFQQHGINSSLCQGIVPPVCTPSFISVPSSAIINQNVTIIWNNPCDSISTRILACSPAVAECNPGSFDFMSTAYSGPAGNFSHDDFFHLLGNWHILIQTLNNGKVWYSNVAAIPVANQLSLTSATWYVSPVGNDNNAGTTDSPFKTLTKAVSMASPGGIIQLLPGTYHIASEMVFSKQGLPGAPITIKGNGLAILDGTGMTGRDILHLSRYQQENHGMYWVIDGLKIMHAPRAGIRLSWVDQVRLNNVEVGYNGVWGVFTDFANNITVTSLNAHHSGEQHGIYFSNSGDNNSLINSTLHDNIGCGSHNNADASMGGDGTSSNFIIANNIISNNSCCINLDGVRESQIYNNLCYNNRAVGIATFAGNGINPGSNTIVHNTIYYQPEVVGNPFPMTIKGGSKDNIIANNIMIGGSRPVIEIDSQSQQQAFVDYNAYFKPSGKWFSYEDHALLSFDDWKNQFGFDAHSLALIFPEEVFVNLSAADFRQRNTSATINAGTNSHSIPFDLQGNARPEEIIVDIGAFEGGIPVVLLNSTPPDANNTVPGNESGDNETAPCTIALFSPAPQIYTSRRILFSLNFSTEGKLSFVDDIDDRPRNKTLCPKCDEYGFTRQKFVTMNDGPHQLRFYLDTGTKDCEAAINFTVDSMKPRIRNIRPMRGYANGSFVVEYQEENLLNATLMINGQPAFAPQCGSGKKESCSFFYSLAQYEGQTIVYNIVLMDIAGNTGASKAKSLEVDSLPPVFTLLDVTRQGNYVFIDVQTDERAKISYEYFDGRRMRTINLCTNCNQKTQKRFIKEQPVDITITAIDKAGNTAFRNVSGT